jgi:hypothetical protein
MFEHELTFEAKGRHEFTNLEVFGHIK